MKPLPLTEELARVAARTVWFQSPQEALSDPLHFIAHVLTYGTYEDVATLRRYVSDEDLARAIHDAPPGIFDERSWAYWNLMIGRYPAPPLPKRELG
jgi:hypothetical protein